MAFGTGARAALSWLSAAGGGGARRGQKKVSFSASPPEVCGVWRKKQVGATVRASPAGPMADSRGGGVIQGGCRPQGAAVVDGPADKGPVVVPSAPAASAREWRDWVQTERAQGLADYHARIMAARELRQHEPGQRRSRTLR